MRYPFVLGNLIILSMLPVTVLGGTSPIEYQPSPMSLTTAIGVIDKLTMTQHPDWRPDYIQIYGQYILWGKGTRTTGRDGRGVNFGRTSAATREIGDRLYFDSIYRIELASWRRSYYVVSIRNEDSEILMYILRTKNLDNAKRFVDAMESVVSSYNQNPEVGLTIAEPRSDEVIMNAEAINSDGQAMDLYTALLKLDDLRQRGILTQAEFDSEKKELLESTSMNVSVTD